MRLEAISNILYLRADATKIIRAVKRSHGLLRYLSSYMEFSEIFCPHFSSVRWAFQDKSSFEKSITSGSLSRLLLKEKGVFTSPHPSHSFVGIGTRVNEVLAKHTYAKNCFYPISELAHKYDFSMLLIGCLDTSPGFSTVHSSQYTLGLSQKHLLRFFQKWDYQANERYLSTIPPESPGCSKNFDRFYNSYRSTNNLISGNWDGVHWIYVPSARNALIAEQKILEVNSRYSCCNRPGCISCLLRLY